MKPYQNKILLRQKLGIACNSDVLKALQCRSNNKLYAVKVTSYTTYNLWVGGSNPLPSWRIAQRVEQQKTAGSSPVPIRSVSSIGRTSD